MVAAPTTPRLSAAAPSFTPTVSSTQNGTFNNDVGANLLRITAENQHRDMLVSARPPKSGRYSGDDRSIDFESHLHKFELVTECEGVTDKLKWLELPHWFCGSAGEVVAMNECERDPGEAVRLAKAQLRRDFGRRNYSAQCMLEELLKGRKIAATDSKTLHSFVLALERIYKKAIQTHRRASFNTPDVMNSILRKRLDWAIPRWSIECVKKEERLEGNEDDSNMDMTFEEFLAFLRRQHRITFKRTTVSGAGESKPNVAESASGDKAGSSKAAAKDDDTRINATGSDAAKPKKNNNTNNKNNNNNRMKANEDKEQRKGMSNDAGDITNNLGENSEANPEISAADPAAAAEAPIDAENAQEPSAQGKGWSCAFCADPRFHRIDACVEFLARDGDGRFTMLKIIGACAACFARGHMKRDCRRKVKCDICGMTHATLLHRDPPAQPAS